jgi:hypothetical protein
MNEQTLPPRPRYELAHISEIPLSASDDRYGFQLVGEWKQVRHHFGIKEFAANAFVATQAGQEIVHTHLEEPNDEQSEVGDEELYYVVSGSAKVKLDDETFAASAGTFIFVGDPGVVRSVSADVAGTTILTFGTNPGVDFVVSKFELEMSPPPRWAS